MRGVPTRGKRSLGLEQLSGRSLVANPPARISPFNGLSHMLEEPDENSVIAFIRTRTGRVLPVIAAGKRLGRKGVDAIFTPDRQQRDARFLVGLAGIVGGIVLWTTVILDSIYPKLFGTSEIGPYLSMVLSSLGIMLVMSGAGICVRYSIFRPVYERSRVPDTLDPSTDRSVLSPVGSSLEGYGEPPVGILSSKNIRFGLIAFVQSCLVLALYSGLVDEYQSNVSMRHWVSSVFSYGQLVLSWEAVLVASTLLGIVVVQFLPGGALSE
jgi:hypothetical protein